MPLRLLQRRTVWFPTAAGWALLVAIVTMPLAFWSWRGEAFLAQTLRQPAEVLIVEGWIGATGVNAAYAEWVSGGYARVVATGGLTGERWNVRRWNYATEAEEQLLHLGIPRQSVLVAPAADVEIQRTFAMALAARRALAVAGDHPTAVNVFTRGSHARRSRLIFEKVFGPNVKVGVIAWHPPLFDEQPWWRSSERAEDLLKETVGYILELVLNSGRRSNSTGPLADAPGSVTWRTSHEEGPFAFISVGAATVPANYGPRDPASPHARVVLARNDGIFLHASLPASL